ncbi:MAG: DUF2357 domain-containing protein [Dysgonamonadaceae bacterium]|nr:DUF2357 domain-containing protein [Dysgonamonadaceae bacterium]
MRKEHGSITVEIKQGLDFTLYPKRDNAFVYEIDTAEAEEYGEATIQILESNSYEYEFSDNSYRLNPTKECRPSKSKKESRGDIEPGNYVGTLELDIIKDGKEELKYHLEVLATKFDADNDYDKSYRKHYRLMLEEITDKCTELLMQSNSPINQYFEPNYDEAHRDVLYQKFSFVKSVINKAEFEESLLRIINSPKTTWVNREESTDIRSFKRFTNKNVREMLRGENRMLVPKTHKLSTRLGCIPTKINNYKQELSLDNAENRFVKHALHVYLQFCERCSDAFKQNSKLLKNWRTI